MVAPRGPETEPAPGAHRPTAVVVLLDARTTDGAAVRAVRRAVVTATTPVTDVVVVDVDPDRGGRGRAMAAGLAATTGEVVVILDAGFGAAGGDVVRRLVAVVADGRADPRGGAVPGGAADGVMAVGQPPVADDDPDGSLPGGVPDLLLRPVVELLVPGLDWLRQPLTAPVAAPRPFLEELSPTDGPAAGLDMVVRAAARLGSTVVIPVDLGDAWVALSVPDEPAALAESVLAAVLPVTPDGGPEAHSPAPG